MNKEGSFKPLFFVMAASLAIAFFWDSISIFKNTAHAILNPSAGALLNWNLTYGLLILVFIITLITTLLQKYTTDQKTLKELKAEQKELQKEMQKFKDHPEKLMELQKQSFAFMPKMMKLSMRPIAYTGIPFILLFRWFMDYFSAPALEGVKFFGFLSWFWFYLLGSMIISGFLRKWMDVA